MELVLDNLRTWVTWDFIMGFLFIYFNKKRKEKKRSWKTLLHFSRHNHLILLPMQPEIPFLPVFSSMKRLMRYSLGSVALGSLIVSFVESIRFMLESIRRKLKVSSTTPHSYIGKAAFHSSRFCFRCIEWTIKSVNRNAYIMVI